MEIKKEHKQAINFALNFIQNNYSKTIDLIDISKKVWFSPYYFHRIFKKIVGQNFSQFINRIRLEKSANFLVYRSNYSITKIAIKCGFSSSQVYARSFRKYYKTTPSEFRAKNNYSKNCNINSKKWKAFKINIQYKDSQGRPEISFISLSDPKMKVEIKTLQPMKLAYIRHFGSYKANDSVFSQWFENLCKRGFSKNIINKSTNYLTIYHDDPNTSIEESQCYIDICISVPENTISDGIMWIQDFPWWKYAVTRYEIKTIPEYEKAWWELFCKWLPESWFELDNRPVFERYKNDPKEHPEWIHIVDICIPVK